MKTTENTRTPFLDLKEEKIKSMRDSIYEFYKLDWMASHNHTLEELFEQIKEIIVEKSHDNTDAVDLVEDSFMSFEIDKGFGGELWACYDEFLECEYLDEDYIDGLIERLAPSEVKPFLERIYKEDISSFLYGREYENEHQ